MVSGDDVSTLWTFVLILNPARFKVYNLVSVHLKNIKLFQMTNRSVIFHVVVSVYRFVIIWISPSFPLNFGMAYSSSLNKGNHDCDGVWISDRN